MMMIEIVTSPAQIVTTPLVSILEFISITGFMLVLMALFSVLELVMG